MRSYTVTWVINIDAETSREAAKKALEIQRDQDSIATCFHVSDDQGGDCYEFDLEIEQLQSEINK